MGLAISFWILAAVAVIAALGVVLLNGVFRSALALVACFLMVAGLYITLSADFLAAVQVLVYVGAISVLIILAIMMTRNVQHGNPGNRFALPSLIIAILLLGIFVYAVTGTQWNISKIAPPDTTVATLADKLFASNGFVLPVEIAALMLLAAVIGAIVLARDK